MKLTPAQRRELSLIFREDKFHTIRFRVADSLRKLGLVDRETHYVVKRIYANANGEHLQWERPGDYPVRWHSWFITPAGRAAITPEPTEPDNG